VVINRRGSGARQAVLRVLASGVERSQAALAREAGLSAAAVSGVVAALVAEDLIVRRSGIENGRRCQLVRLRAGERVVAGVDIGRTHLRVALGHGVHEILAERLLDLAPGHRPETTLARVRATLADMVGDAGVASEALACVGVGLPGPVERSSSSVVSGTILPGWVGVGVPEHLEGVADEVVVENDANLGAIATCAVAGVHDLVYVKIGTGVGAGLVLRGRLVLGRSGLAGELGHMAVPGAAGGMCRCGRRGCLETVSSLDAVAAALTSVTDRRVRTGDVLGLSRSAEPLVRRVLDDAGEALGRAVGTWCTLVDPGTVVLGGQVWPGLLRSVHTGFHRTTLPAIAAATDLRLSTLDDRAEVLGALHLARSRAHPLGDLSGAGPP
jgi:predicted NBD/HSP70 family sugar kinase